MKQRTTHNAQQFYFTSLKFILFGIISFFSACQTEEDIVSTEPAVKAYNSDIQNYFDRLPITKNDFSFFIVDDLKAKIDYTSVESFDLNSGQKLIMADLNPIFDNDKITATKIVFYFQNNRIVKSRIFTFEDDSFFSDYNTNIKYMLSNETEKITYSGNMRIYSEDGRFQFLGILDKGKLLKNERVYPKLPSNNTKTASERCVSWYRVVKIGEQIISATYAYTICQGSTDGSSGGSGAGSGSNSGPYVILPDDPDDKTLHTHIDDNGLITEYIYDKANKKWDWVKIIIPEVIIYTYPKYQFLGNINFPSHGQIVIGLQSSFQYNTYTGSWIEKPIVLLEDPCASLKKLTTNTEYTGRIQTLVANTTNSDHKERGYKENLDGTFVQLINGSNGANNHSLDIDVDSNTKGYLHNHVDPYPDGTYDADGNPNMVTPIHLFSPADITRFLIMVKNAHSSNTPLSDIYGTMVSSSGTYTLKYSGIYPANFNFSNLNIDDRYISYFEKEINAEKAFLLFLKNEIGIQGVELFKVSADGSLNKKSLNSTNTVQNTPCTN